MPFFNSLCATNIHRVFIAEAFVSTSFYNDFAFITAGARESFIWTFYRSFKSSVNTTEIGVPLSKLSFKSDMTYHGRSKVRWVAISLSIILQKKLL